jgi:hypothetical protein
MIPALFALTFALCLGETPSWWLPVPWVAGSATAGHFVSLDAFGVFDTLDAFGTAALPLLADASVTPTQLGIGLGVIGVLLGLYLKFGKAKQQLVGEIIAEILSQQKATRVDVQSPLEIVSATRCVEHSELQLKLEGYVRREDLRSAELRIEDKIDSKFTLLDGKRSDDIADLHKKIEVTSDTMRAEIEDKARETRQKIDEVPARVLDMLQKTGAIGRGGSK